MNYSAGDLFRDIAVLARQIPKNRFAWIYPVPRGGVPVALALKAHLNLPFLDRVKEDMNCSDNILVVDDVVDSGRTRMEYKSLAFASIHVKDTTPERYYPTYFVRRESEWIDYFWEAKESLQEKEEEDIITSSLRIIGEDPRRDGLIDTPRRVLKSWKHLFKGYEEDPLQYIKAFDMPGYDQMVLLKNIEIYSMCEHHMLPFFGRAHVGYIPGGEGRVVGVSKLARILDIFARRLQIQERIGQQVTSFLMENLSPIGAACVIEADHLCMRMRGVEKQNSIMVTSSLQGVFLEDSERGRAARSEFMGLIK